MAIHGHAADLPHDPVVWQFFRPKWVHFKLWRLEDFGGPGAGDDEQTNSQDNSKHEGGRSWRNFVYAQSLLLSKRFGKPIGCKRFRKRITLRRRVRKGNTEG